MPLICLSFHILYVSLHGVSTSFILLINLLLSNSLIYQNLKNAYIQMLKFFSFICIHKYINDRKLLHLITVCFKKTGTTFGHTSRNRRDLFIALNLVQTDYLETKTNVMIIWTYLKRVSYINTPTYLIHNFPSSINKSICEKVCHAFLSLS